MHQIGTRIRLAFRNGARDTLRQQDPELSMTEEPLADEGFLPEHIGLQWGERAPGLASAKLAVSRRHMAPNRYLHAASVIGLADSVCGFGCMASLPQGAVSFTTIELKSNFLGTAREGETIAAEGRLAHGGRTTQVWDAVVTNEATGKTIALFRCTQMLIYPKA
jgi:1,4-dihydroxy-2-naphthoyl-CoA hydrolase